MAILSVISSSKTLKLPNAFLHNTSQYAPMANCGQLIVPTPAPLTTKNSDRANAMRLRTPSGEAMIWYQAT